MGKNYSNGRLEKANRQAMSSSQILYAINKNKVRAPVAQTLESAIQRINHFSVDKYKVTNCAIHWIEICRVDTAIHTLRLQRNLYLGRE